MTGRLAEEFEDCGMLEGEILLDEAKLRAVAASQAQHVGEVMERDGAPQVVWK